VLAYVADGGNYPAAVAEVRDDGTFLVNWADGDPQDRVKTAEEMQRITVTVTDIFGHTIPDNPRQLDDRRGS